MFFESLVSRNNFPFEAKLIGDLNDLVIGLQQHPYRVFHSDLVDIDCKGFSGFYCSLFFCL